MCREKNHPKGPHRCKGVNPASRRARRAANTLYRNSLADYLERRDRTELAEKVRTSSFTSMPALTAAAGLHPTDLVGGAGRVPGLSNTHALTDADIALAREVAEESGTKIDFVDGRAVLRDTSYDPVRDVIAAEVRQAADDAAGDLPADPEPGDPPQWDPAELSEEANADAAAARLTALGELDPNDPNYAAALDKHAKAYEDHVVANAVSYGGYGGLHARAELAALATESAGQGTYADAYAALERKQAGERVEHVGAPVALDDLGIPVWVEEDDDFRDAVAEMDNDERIAVLDSLAAAGDEECIAADILRTEYSDTTAGVRDAAESRAAALDARARYVAAQYTLAATTDEDTRVEAYNALMPTTTPNGSAEARRAQARADLYAAPDADIYGERVARLSAAVTEPGEVPDITRPDYNNLVSHAENQVIDAYSESAAPDPETVTRHTVQAMEAAALAYERDGDVEAAAQSRVAAREVPYLVSQAQWVRDCGDDEAEDRIDALTRAASDMHFFHAGERDAGDFCDVYTPAHVARDMGHYDAGVAGLEAAPITDLPLSAHSRRSLAEGALHTDMINYARATSAVPGFEGRADDAARLEVLDRDTTARTRAISEFLDRYQSPRAVTAAEAAGQTGAPLAALSQIDPDAVASVVDARTTDYARGAAKVALDDDALYAARRHNSLGAAVHSPATEDSACLVGGGYGLSDVYRAKVAPEHRRAAALRLAGALDLGADTYTAERGADEDTAAALRARFWADYRRELAAVDDDPEALTRITRIADAASDPVYYAEIAERVERGSVRLSR